MVSPEFLPRRGVPSFSSSCSRMITALVSWKLRCLMYVRVEEDMIDGDDWLGVQVEYQWSRLG